jgi:hypothetical protein
MALQLPPVIANNQPVLPPVVPDKKKYILCISKDLNDDDFSLFKPFNLVIYDDDIHKNIPINSYDFDILVLDMRKRGDRYTLMKEVIVNKESYFLILYVHSFEIEQDFVENPDNVLTKFPQKQARKEDFLALLLVKRIKKPRWYVSLFCCLYNAYNKAKN